MGLGLFSEWRGFCHCGDQDLSGTTRTLMGHGPRKVGSGFFFPYTSSTPLLVFGIPLKCARTRRHTYSPKHGKVSQSRSRPVFLRGWLAV